MSGPALLVTGATGALGGAVAARLAAEGRDVLLTGRNEARLKELAEGLREAGAGPGALETVAADAATEDGARTAVRAALDRFGALHGLVHLIGGFAVGPVMRTGAQEHRDLYHANVVSAVEATRAVLPHLGEGGRLVYVSSLLAAEPFPAMGAYAASKAALQAWVRSLAHEVKDRGVRANTVVMTMADTPEARASRPGVDFDMATRPEEVAEVIAFLTGAGAEGVNGAAVPVLGRFAFSTPMLGGSPGGGPPGGPPGGHG
ncbi:SDR family NAD(P)-dependent oxidoreductase [Nocardiopsis sp. RSe5-2]|uniref:SDR family NAD(P)-dependent oxidoreductase n=1 Tax=Nocardiopsis endophytica TaxID=3018445 RepID=A0ABT4U985_9ACTN|nr:SDR family oxidoreductase [Nocardiopsis endophytica]MDA2812975.1 SDR family NAD(P)-dependent oxidoreductase [Nocardiopsis endophytica]